MIRAVETQGLGLHVHAQEAAAERSSAGGRDLEEATRSAQARDRHDALIEERGDERRQQVVAGTLGGRVVAVERTVTRIELHAEGLERTRVVLVDGPYDEMMAPHAEAGWTQQFGKLERLLAR